MSEEAPDSLSARLEIVRILGKLEAKVDALTEINRQQDEAQTRVCERLRAVESYIATTKTISMAIGAIAAVIITALASAADHVLRWFGRP